MRRNSPRKWLHAILDLLPLVILPIFALAVRSDNNFQPIEVQAQDYEVVDFNQKVKNGNFDNLTNWSTYNLSSTTFSVNDNVVNIGGRTSSTASYLRTIDYSIFELNHIYYARCFVFQSSGSTMSLSIGQPYNYNSVNVANNTETMLKYRWKCTSVNNQNFLNIGNRQANNTYYEFQVYQVNLFDFTQMYGLGNEPTIEQFELSFSSSFYDYTLSKKELLNVGTTTYNDTDVGSQLVYTLYNATEKYFNFRQVGNFNDIYTWLEINMFNGNAPLLVPVVYNIILYELIMDIIFLMYAVFMFIVDFAERMLDCLFDKSFGGGR